MHDKYIEGLAEGEAKGEARGIEKRNVEIAVNMLKDNEPLEKIIRFTGLSEQDIAKLKREIEC